MAEFGYRFPRQITTGIVLDDPAGTSLRRYIGTPELEAIDPFLLLDWFETDRVPQHAKGFAPHPHRGFETITVIYEGHMAHRDNTGHRGMVGPGGIQVMRAGAGILHAEQPRPGGPLKGLQFWLNLPRAEKQAAPHYQHLDGPDVPVERHAGAVVRVLMGASAAGSRSAIAARSTEPILFDLALEPGASFEQALPAGHAVFLVVVAGAIALADAGGAEVPAEAGALVRLGSGERVRLAARAAARVLLVAGRPIGEPVARGGPFVMTTRPEVLQAFKDYQEGRFGPPVPAAPAS